MATIEPKIKIPQKQAAQTIDSPERILHWTGMINYTVALVLDAVLLLLWNMSALQFDPAPIILFWVPLFLLLGLAQVIIAEKSSKHAERFIYPSLVISFVIISIIIHLTGVRHGEFLFLYTVPIATAALVSTPASVIAVAATAGSYFLIEFAEADLQSVSVFSRGIGADEIRHTTVVLLIGFLMAFQTRYYISRIKAKDEELLRTKDDFLFRTVHDLRSPSTTIKFIAEKYEQPAMIKKYPEIKNDLKNIYDLAIRMLHLVRDLLEAVQGGRSELVFRKESLDAKVLLDRSLEENRNAIQQKKLKLHLDTARKLPLVLADPERLLEVFDNLVENAVKYNVEAGEIWLSLSTAPGFLAVRIRNSVEQKISKTTISKLFTPFFRDPPRSNISGTGLGLYVCKKLVEKMGGSIRALTEDEKTITFEVLLLTK